MLRSRGYDVEVDLSPAEREGVYLEGTGVLVPPSSPRFPPTLRPLLLVRHFRRSAGCLRPRAGRPTVSAHPMPPGGAPRFRRATYAWLSCTRRAGRVGRVLDRVTIV